MKFNIDALTSDNNLYKQILPQIIILRFASTKLNIEFHPHYVKSVFAKNVPEWLRPIERGEHQGMKHLAYALKFKAFLAYFLSLMFN